MTSLDSAPERAGVSPPADISKPGDRVAQGATVHHGLQVTAAYAWRVIIVAAAVYLLFAVLAKLTLVAVAVFVGLVITALLRPLVDLLSHKIPRGLSVAVTLLLTIVAIGAIFTFVADSVASQTKQLSNQFVSGLNEIERSLAGAPFHIRAANLTQAGQQIRAWVTQNGGSLAGQALGGASVAAEVLTGLALAVFCSVFFLNSGSRIWDWLLTQVGGNNHRWDGAARAGWATFAGYTRGIVIIAALVCVALLILRVPLALPLALLTFFATFIPLIGAPIALFVATLVALAARGPLIALLVLALIVLIGQIEGHLLQPLVMSRAVNIHPLAVALSVASGTVIAGVIGAVVAVPLVAVTWTVWTTLKTHAGWDNQRAETKQHPDPGHSQSP
jgi:predicted PurR-regulated permease PerM